MLTILTLAMVFQNTTCRHKHTWWNTFKWQSYFGSHTSGNLITSKCLIFLISGNPGCAYNISTCCVIYRLFLYISVEINSSAIECIVLVFVVRMCVCVSLGVFEASSDHLLPLLFQFSPFFLLRIRFRRYFTLPKGPQFSQYIFSPSDTHTHS